MKKAKVRIKRNVVHRVIHFKGYKDNLTSKNSLLVNQNLFGVKNMKFPL